MKNLRTLTLASAFLTTFGAWATSAHNAPVTWFERTDIGEIEQVGTLMQLKGSTSMPKNALVVTKARAQLTAYEGGEEREALWPHVQHYPSHTSVPNAALSMRKHFDGSLTFIGWSCSFDTGHVRGRWLELAAEGVEPSETEMFDLMIEVDHSTIPSRARYSVNGHKLTDKLGHDWFSIQSSGLDPEYKDAQNKKPNYIGILGKGNVASIKTTYATTERTPRGTIDMGDVPRLAGGNTNITPVVTANEGVTLGNLTYTWYLTDATGMRGETPIAIGETYGAKKSDAAHWITVEVSDENGFVAEGRTWFSDLPVVYVNEDNGAWPTKDKEEHTGTIRIVGNEEFPDQLDGKTIVLDGLHVRGNTTATQVKKPYKLKFEKKYNVFGLSGEDGKNKHWLLLANYQDESLMRNKIAYDFSGIAGVTNMECEWVDVIMNGQYIGNYLFCEHIRVAEERIDIFEWDTGKVAENALIANPALTKDDEGAIDELLETNCQWITSAQFTYLGTNYTISTNKKYKDKANVDENGNVIVYWKDYTSDITGGYIFEICHKKVSDADGKAFYGAQYDPMPSSLICYANGGLRSIKFDVAVNTPEFCFTEPAFSNQVWDIWYNLGQAWTSGTGYNNLTGRHYSEFADMESMTGYWLTQFLFGNTDAAGHSRYSYLGHGEKMKFGPAWDFDHTADSLEVRNYPSTFVTTNEYGSLFYYKPNPRSVAPGAGESNFMGFWTADPYFVYVLREKYKRLRPFFDDLVKEGGLIDRYKAKLGASALANDLRWNNRIGFHPTTDESDGGDVEVYRKYMTEHIAWYDELFGDTLGEAVVNLSKQSAGCPSAMSFTRTDTIAPAFEDATTVPDTEETTVADVTTVIKRSIAFKVAVPTSNAATLDIYVNGVSNQASRIEGGLVNVTLPVTALSAAGKKTFLSFMAKDAAGKTLENNIALLTWTLPEEIAADDTTAPGITISWLDEKWAAMAITNPEAMADVPVPQTYDDYVAFVNQKPSLIGKPYALADDYIAGTDPADTNELFASSITIDEYGIPRITWSPDKPELRATRKYTLMGKEKLTDSQWAETNAENPGEDFLKNNNFFQTRVEMEAK